MMCLWPVLWNISTFWCRMCLNWWGRLIPDWFLQSNQSVRNFQKWPSFCSLLIIFSFFFFGRSELPGLRWGHYGTARPNSAGSELRLLSLAEENSTFVHLHKEDHSLNSLCLSSVVNVSDFLNIFERYFSIVYWFFFFYTFVTFNRSPSSWKQNSP